MTFADFVQICCQKLALANGAPGDRETAEPFAERTFDDLLRFIRIDEPSLMPVFLLGTSAGLGKFDSVLSGVVVARLRRAPTPGNTYPARGRFGHADRASAAREGLSPAKRGRLSTPPDYEHDCAELKRRGQASIIVKP